MSAIIAVDFGGTKLSVGIADLGLGTVLEKSIRPTPQSANSSIAAVTSMVHSLLAKADSIQPAAIGVSFGGLVSGDGSTIKTSHHVPGWENYPLAEYLESTLNLPVQIINDADAAALGEYHFGAGQGVHSLLYLTVSTGIGAGIVLDGNIYQGETALAGEIGHMVMLPDGPICPCGRRGCLEALASGRSIARSMSNAIRGGRRSNLKASGVTTKQVAAAAAKGDPLAARVWFDAMNWLGIGVANAANLLNPGRVVIGGGLSKAGSLLFDPVRESANRHILDHRLEIQPALLGEDANLLGAGALWEAK
jgi:glucokinase